MAKNREGKKSEYRRGGNRKKNPEKYTPLLSALTELSADPAQPKDTKSEAQGLMKKLNMLENSILIEFLDHILERFQKSSLSLQSPNVSLNTATTLLKSLRDFVETRRDMFEHFEELGMKKSPTGIYKQIRN